MEHLLTGKVHLKRLVLSETKDNTYWQKETLTHLLNKKWFLRWIMQNTTVMTWYHRRRYQKYKDLTDNHFSTSVSSLQADICLSQETSLKEKKKSMRYTQSPGTNNLLHFISTVLILWLRLTTDYLPLLYSTQFSFFQLLEENTLVDTCE